MGKFPLYFFFCLFLSKTLAKVLKNGQIVLFCDKNCNFSLCETDTLDFIYKSFRFHGLEREKQRGHASLNLKINQKHNLNDGAMNCYV